MRLFAAWSVLGLSIVKVSLPSFRTFIETPGCRGAAGRHGPRNTLAAQHQRRPRHAMGAQPGDLIDRIHYAMTELRRRVGKTNCARANQVRHRLDVSTIILADGGADDLQAQYPSCLFKSRVGRLRDHEFGETQVWPPIARPITRCLKGNQDAFAAARREAPISKGSGTYKMKKPVQHLCLKPNNAGKDGRPMSVLGEEYLERFFRDLKNVVAAKLHIKVCPIRPPVYITRFGNPQLLHNIGCRCALYQKLGAYHDRRL